MVALHTLLSNLVFSPLPLSLSPPFPGFFRCFSHPLVGFWHQTNWGVALHAEKRQRDGCGPPRTQQNMGNLSTGHWEKCISVVQIFKTTRERRRKLFRWQKYLLYYKIAVTQQLYCIFMKISVAFKHVSLCIYIIINFNTIASLYSEFD